MTTVSSHITGHTVYEHWIQVPLDYFGALNGLPHNAELDYVPKTINVFAREIVRAGCEDKPRLVYLEGGPGFAAPRPRVFSGWMDEVLKNYRLVLLDERGTGNSFPLDARTLSVMGNAEGQAEVLTCFRQDSIVRDAEAMRTYLQDDEPWSVLGQSFGGFTAVCYLSQAPSGLREVFLTGGLPSIQEGPDEVYRRTYRRLSERNRQFFTRYPQDEETAWYLATHLADVEETLPSGERLTPARFRQLGLKLGYSWGLEHLHYLLEDPIFTFRGERRLRPEFLQRVGAALSSATAPLYAILQEAIYGQSEKGALAYSAHRIRSEFPEFQLPAREAGGSGEHDLRKAGYGFRFTGEMVYPWQFQEDPALRAAAGAVEQLAFRTSWRDLYNREQLAENQVPVAAYVFYDDMYVPFELSMRTAREINGLQPIVTNTYQHDALGVAGPEVIRNLLRAIR
ncbi:Pimeloyl-ACP methyl ester carboxylesterase [Actinobaculum suis]|uniref:Alpha/beta fold hydrolase n=1 Tax=Actinobaculum suis TaxID=1657 RepID=A0A0K9ETJ4_9ACTO|nr:alpha/beta fold hydrolase [Actinobaculum suis]KMY23205.1 alpha/beta hydrolase [Actinobaculum suis]MDY5152654.1 alpha/beta fold hydrolase [Actinobaculum suis]SDE10956.1 Pimeloyl-ACP methyl ester carboxylesterase [Actinobaculum suis]VDG75408.1 hydrolase, alpha/beta fold family [Actinobaculum suis]